MQRKLDAVLVNLSKVRLPYFSTLQAYLNFLVQKVLLIKDK